MEQGMAECFPGNPAWEGCSPILPVNALVPIVLAPGAHVCLQIIFLLKAKEQKPKNPPPKLENNFIQAHLLEVQHSALSFQNPRQQHRRQFHVFYMEEKNIFSSRKLKTASLRDWGRKCSKSNDVFGFSKFYLI